MQPFLFLFSITIILLISFSAVHVTAAAIKVSSVPPLLDVPAYSLATLSSDGTTTMNIHTYASPVGIRPDRKWCISLYRDTLSHENFARQKEGVLQLLRKPHTSIVKLLGGSSGRDINKQLECEMQGLRWIEVNKNGPLVLPQCACYLHLSLQGDLIDAGDHDIAICTVKEIYMDEDIQQSLEIEHLTTGYLRSLELITPQGRVVEDEVSDS